MKRPTRSSTPAAAAERVLVASDQNRLTTEYLTIKKYLKPIESEANGRLADYLLLLAKELR